MTHTTRTIDNYRRVRATKRPLNYPILSLTTPPSLPLDRPRRLAGHVIHHAVHPLDLVDDAGGDAAQEGHVEGIEVGRHAVAGGDGAQAHHVVVGAVVTHHAHGLDRQQHREGLPDVVVEPGAADFLDVDFVGE